MKQTILGTQKFPTAHLAVNKSRVKIYNKEVEIPTYYLQNGQEFQIEIFNPTTSVVLAKITLNGKTISQGGLVINPGQRIFLERYLDVAKKFLFDTYEVEASQEVKEAIASNGDFKVEFFREKTQVYYDIFSPLSSRTGGIFGGPNYNNTFTTNSLGFNIELSTSSALYSSSIPISNTTTFSQRTEPIVKSRSAKSIETGRVEQGSSSTQKLKTVDMDFEYLSFYTIEYKMLPISQKINSLEDINVKVYCTNCGSKLGKGDKFCSKCGTKA
tara:strand:- start:1720 stop:2532 length:813 start_codon:yes stop_codon:yes gene_type:complete